MKCSPSEGREEKLEMLLAELNRLREKIRGTILLDPFYRKLYEVLYNELTSIYPELAEVLVPPGQILDPSHLRYAVEILHNAVNALSARSPSVPAPSLPDPLRDIMAGLGLGTEWAVAAAALSLMEVMVNHKLSRLGLDAGGEFKKRVERLAGEARRRGVEFPDLLAGAFWDVRSKVLHGGRQPTQEELGIILQYLKTLHDALSRLDAAQAPHR